MGGGRRPGGGANGGKEKRESQGDTLSLPRWGPPLPNSCPLLAPCAWCLGNQWWQWLLSLSCLSNLPFTMSFLPSLSYEGSHLPLWLILCLFVALFIFSISISISISTSHTHPSSSSHIHTHIVAQILARNVLFFHLSCLSPFSPYATMFLSCFSVGFPPFSALFFHWREVPAFGRTSFSSWDQSTCITAKGTHSNPHTFIPLATHPHPFLYLSLLSSSANLSLQSTPHYLNPFYFISGSLFYISSRIHLMCCRRLPALSTNIRGEKMSSKKKTIGVN